MALFKIFKGRKANLPTTKTDGYAYFTTDDGKFYIDHAGQGQNLAVRTCINPTMVGATDETAGKEGMVPSAGVADKNKFLKGDGTWEEVDITIPDLEDLTGVLPVSKGGTGATSEEGARNSLGLGSAAVANTSSSVGNNSNLPTGAAIQSYVTGLGYQKNQNAFSNIKINSTTIAAESKTDTFELAAGSNITLTPDATNDKITIAATDTKYTAATAAPGKVASSSAQGSSTNYARQDHTHGIDLASGDSDGQVKIAGTNVSVKGLKSAAYTESSAYATAAQGTLAANAIPKSQKGSANGVAELDANGLVPSSQLPSYVDDVLEYSAKSSFPTTGETGKIYIDTSTNKTYRWSGSNYVEISASLALGETSSTAYRGDRGKTAYDHASAKGSAFSSGLYKITTNAQGHVTAATAVVKADITALGIPETNTTYSGLTQALVDTGTETTNKLVTAKILSDTAQQNTAFGTCATAAGDQVKVVSVSKSWKLTVGCVVGVKFTNTNSYSATVEAPCQLNVNNSGAKNIYYNNTPNTTGINTTAFGVANRFTFYMYDGTYWVWINQSVDNNTTYSNMSQTEATAGTATTARTISAKVLNDTITGKVSKYLPLTGGTLTGALSGTTATMSGAITSGGDITFGDGTDAVLNAKTPSRNAGILWVGGGKKTAGTSEGTVVRLQGGGLTMVGGGEYANNRYNLADLADGDEQLYLGADSTVYIETNGQTIANRKTFTFGTDGSFNSPGTIKQNGTAVSLTGHTHSLANVGATTTTVGSASAGTAIAADDITAYTAGTAATLTYTSRSIPNVTAAGTASVSNGVLSITNTTLGTAIAADDITAWTTNTPTSVTYTARSIPNISVTNKTVLTTA